MPVEVVKTEPKCKLCSHPNRQEIDELLEARSFRRRTEDGQAINLEFCLARFAEMGVENPTADNVKGHTKRHVRFVDHAERERLDEEAEKEAGVERALRDEALRLLTQVLGEDWRERGVTPTPEQILEIQRVLYVHELELRLAAGLPSGVTHDQVLKGVGEATKRKHNAAQDELLKSLSGGIERVFEKALGPGEEPRALPGPVIEIEDAEVIEDA